jgi:hypothetical protein
VSERFTDEAAEGGGVGVFGPAFCKEGETAEPSRFFAGDSESPAKSGAPQAHPTQ